MNNKNLKNKMYFVFDNPYLSLDEFLDIPSLDAIIDDIILGIAKSRTTAGPTNSGLGYVDKTKKSVPEIYREISADPSHPYYNLLTSLKDWEPQTFIQYKWPSHVLGHCILLRVGSSYDTKNSAKDSIDFPAIKNFKPLIDWVDSQNVFEEVGRIIIFLNDPFSKTIEHRDYPDGISRKDNFIWINPLMRKRFYVKDNDTKHYVESKVAFFDSANVHGSDPSDTSCFSIRFDGKFSEDFLNRTGLNSWTT
jgi:hypothetical protein